MFAKGIKKGTIQFTLTPGGAATKVELAGDFTSWKPRAMKKQKNGTFAAAVALPAGAYEYRFVVDGKWIADPDHSHWAPNPFGSFNSVAKVQ